MTLIHTSLRCCRAYPFILIDPLHLLWALLILFPVVVYDVCSRFRRCGDHWYTLFCYYIAIRCSHSRWNVFGRTLRPHSLDPLLEFGLLIQNVVRIYMIYPRYIYRIYGSFLLFFTTLSVPAFTVRYGCVAPRRYIALLRISFCGSVLTPFVADTFTYVCVIYYTLLLRYLRFTRLLPLFRLHPLCGPRTARDFTTHTTFRRLPITFTVTTYHHHYATARIRVLDTSRSLPTALPLRVTHARTSLPHAPRRSPIYCVRYRTRCSYYSSLFPYCYTICYIVTLDVPVTVPRWLFDLLLPGPFLPSTISVTSVTHYGTLRYPYTRCYCPHYLYPRLPHYHHTVAYHHTTPTIYVTHWLGGRSLVLRFDRAADRATLPCRCSTPRFDVIRCCVYGAVCCWVTRFSSTLLYHTRYPHYVTVVVDYSTFTISHRIHYHTPFYHSHLHIVTYDVTFDFLRSLHLVENLS